MQYYISWTHSDLIYQEFLPNVSVLVSPPNVSLAWKVRDWTVMPDNLILDSGAYQYAKGKKEPQPGEVLDRQLRMLETVNVPTGICHADLPMLGLKQIQDLDRRVIRNLENAAQLMKWVEANGLPKHIYPIGVIQGYSVEKIHAVAQELAELGYTHFALGSLARMVANSGDELIRRVEAALEAVGSNIHVLGVSSIRMLQQLAQLGVRSVDSGSPIREAWMGGIYYSRPWRRYKIASPHFKEWRRSYGFAELLHEPLPCSCPVCQIEAESIIRPSGKVNINKRALHNCYHLMREFSELDPHPAGSPVG